MVLHQTSSPGSHLGIARTQAGVLDFFLGLRICSIKRAASALEIVTAPLSAPCCQSISGLHASKKGYPRIKSSGPISATKNLWVASCPLYRIFQGRHLLYLSAFVGCSINVANFARSFEFARFEAQLFEDAWVDEIFSCTAIQQCFPIDSFISSSECRRNFYCMVPRDVYRARVYRPSESRGTQAL